jgi:Protein of unknown function (DUF2971)
VLVTLRIAAVPLNKHLRRLWADAGYLESAGSAAVTPPPGPKYRRVYYTTSAEFAISNLVFGRLKVARFKSLNDPFELLAPKFSDKRLRRVMGNFKRQFDNENGLICFSGDWIDPVLWTHYGAKHTGICLGLNVKRDLLRRVNYVTERMVTDISDDAINQKLENVIIRTKFESWSYEEEYRILVPLKNADEEGSLHFLSFDDDVQLAEVIIGAQSDIRADHLRKIVNKHYPPGKVTTIKSRLASKSFYIVPLEASVPEVPTR